MSVEITVDPEQKIAKMLKAIKDEGGNLKVPFNSIARSWFKSNRSIFLLKGPGKYPDLGGFNPSAPSSLRSTTGNVVTRRTAAKFQKLREVGFVYPLMKRKGQLEKSLTSPTDSNAVNYIVNKVALYLGTRVGHAIFHQSPLPREKMPFRPTVFLGVEQLAPPEKKADYERYNSILEQHLAQVIVRNGGVK